MYRYLDTAKKKCERVRQFQREYVYVDRKGEIHDIICRSFWTPEGRVKILKSIKARLYKMLKDFDCSYQITLTYRDFSDYSKKDISRFLNSFLRGLRYRKIRFRYFWVAEIQKRGMIHYHILLFVKRKDRNKVFGYMNKERIDRLWGKGFTFITFSAKTIKKAYSYATKYLLKQFKSEYYLELVAFFRDAFGSFRMYGMSQIKRWGEMFRRKWLEEMTRAALQYDFSEPVKILENIPLDKVLFWCPWLIGYAERRTGKICHRKRDFPPFYFDKGVDKILLDVYNRKKEEDEWLENFILRGF